MLKLPQRRARRNRAGFSVVEVVVASAVMVVVFAAVFGTFSFARRSVSVTENQLACLHIARQTLENLVIQTYTSPDLAVGTKQLPGGRGNYVVTEDGDGKTKNITVVINWVEPSGMNRSVSLTTSFSRSLHK